MELARDTFLADRFQILGPLKEGGAPEAYLASDRLNHVGSLQVLVALRVIDREACNVKELREEVAALEAIKNEHVLRVYELVESPALLAVSIERVDGKSLAQVMEQRIFSSRELVERLLHLAYGIEAFHGADIIHGALTIYSIYCTNDGTFKIDPAVRKAKSGDSPSADISALTAIGKDLAAGSLHYPKLPYLIPYKNLWYTEVVHPPIIHELLDKLEGEEKIESVIRELERVKSVLAKQPEAFQVKAVLSGNSPVIVISMLILFLMTALCWVSVYLVR